MPVITVSATEIIKAAGRLIGELRSGRTFNDLEMNDFHVTLNTMIAEWAAEGGMIPAVSEDTLQLNGAASYLWGPFGAITTEKPVDILSAETRTAAGVTAPVRVVDVLAWNAQLRDQQETGLLVEMLFFDWEPSTITLRTWPKVTSGTLAIWSLKPLVGFPGLGNFMLVPAGYDEAMILNLAVRMAAEFGKSPSPEVTAGAERARGALKRLNAHLVSSVAPAAVPGG